MLSFHAKVVHFTFYIAMVFQNFVVDFKEKNIFTKAVVSQNVMFYLPYRFSGWVKTFKLVSVFRNLFLIFKKFTKKYSINDYFTINDYGGVH